MTLCQIDLVQNIDNNHSRAAAQIMLDYMNSLEMSLNLREIRIIVMRHIVILKGKKQQFFDKILLTKIKVF